MELIDALLCNTEALRHKADELGDRIHLLRDKGQSAEPSISELIATCEEIGRLNDEIHRQLAKRRGG